MIAEAIDTMLTLGWALLAWQFTEQAYAAYLKHTPTLERTAAP